MAAQEQQEAAIVPVRTGATACNHLSQVQRFITPVAAAVATAPHQAAVSVAAVQDPLAEQEPQEQRTQAAVAAAVTPLAATAVPVL